MSSRMGVGCRRCLSWLFLAVPLAALALPPPPVPPQNPITEPKRILGKILFWDEQLSSDQTVACGTCHQFSAAGSDPRRAVNPGSDRLFGTADDVNGSFGVVRRAASGQPIPDPLFGFARQVTRRNAPQVPGALWAPDLFLDGRATSKFVDPQSGLVSIPSGGALESQSLAPILSAQEMATDNRTWGDVVARLQGVRPLALATYLPPDVRAALAGGPDYPQLFASAFGTTAITAERIAYAIATYERTLVPDQTPYDAGTLTPAQQAGLSVFLDANSACNACHAAPLFTDNTFRNIGVRPIAEDAGRQEVTGNAADAGRFRVSTVRNVGLKKFFMHNGRQTTLEQVVDFYRNSNGQTQFPQNQDPLMDGIAIGSSRRADLIEFMRNGLTDPRMANGLFPFDQPILGSQRGDANRDGKVDAADRALLVRCFSGEGGGPVAADCITLDMDGDTDVDCSDWRAFIRVWTDAGPPEPLAACIVPVPASTPWLHFAMLVSLLGAAALAMRAGEPRRR